MEKQTKKYLIGGGVALFILILAAWYFYSSGKKTVTIASLPVDDPATGTTSNLSGTSDADVSALATELFNDLDEYDLFSNHDAAPYNTALAMSDTSFVKLYNFYNTKYQVNDGGQTLAMKVEAQNAIPYTSWDALRDGMIKRFGKLNLK